MTGILAALAGSGSGSASSGYTVVLGNLYNLDYGYLAASYSGSTDIGTISPTGTSPYGSVAILGLYTATYDSSTYLVISGNRSGSWTTMTVDSTPLSYASATRTYDSGNDYTTWQWSGTTPLGTTTNSSHTVSFS